MAAVSLLGSSQHHSAQHGLDGSVRWRRLSRRWTVHDMRQQVQLSVQPSAPRGKVRCSVIAAASSHSAGGWSLSGNPSGLGTTADARSTAQDNGRIIGFRTRVPASGNANAAVGDFFSMLGQMMQQQQPAAKTPSGAALGIKDMTYQPPGTAKPLLQKIDLQLPANKMGLVYGRSGAGKTTLLKIVAGLAQHDQGRVVIGPEAAQLATQPALANDGNGAPSAVHSGNGSNSVASAGAAAISAASASTGRATAGSSGNGATLPMVASAAQQRTRQTGMVFQFPERHFLGKTIADELTFGWPGRPEDMLTRQQLGLRCQRVLDAVGMGSMDLEASPNSLSDGYKRRLALAVQLVRGPSILLLDEPLAGLDWRSRSDIAQLLGKLKQECTVLVVSHDLHELEQQVDVAWEMLPGGLLVPATWPPPK